MNGNSCVDIEWRVQYDNAVVNGDETLKLFRTEGEQTREETGFETRV